MYGTVTYVGITTGCLISAAILSFKGNKQKILAISMLIHGATLFAFTLTPNFQFNCFIRLIDGLTKSMPYVFCPVWPASYSPEITKSAWIALMILPPKVGTAIGFSVTSFIT